MDTQFFATEYLRAQQEKQAASAYLPWDVVEENALRNTRDAAIAGGLNKQNHLAFLTELKAERRIAEAAGRGSLRGAGLGAGLGGIAGALIGGAVGVDPMDVLAITGLGGVAGAAIGIPTGGSIGTQRAANREGAAFDNIMGSVSEYPVEVVDVSKAPISPLMAVNVDGRVQKLEEKDLEELPTRFAPYFQAIEAQSNGLAR